ncbi:MAG: hypothetical protein KAS32_10770 [Candidatus Peribacteraceae bacterium]|nr:hypothetical protein [Candidatus Peribacteraceae bacterium]
MAEKIVDRRSNANKDSVFRVKLAQFTWADGVTAAESKAVPVNGRVRVIAGTTNNSTNAITYTTTIADEDSNQLYTKADWAESATEIVTLTVSTEVYVPAGSTITITPSADPGSTGGTFDITLIGA